MARNKRPVKIFKKEDISVSLLERINDHYDTEIQKLDERKIAQVTELDSGETDVPTIVAKINSLLSAMNSSELTED